MHVAIAKNSVQSVGAQISALRTMILQVGKGTDTMPPRVRVVDFLVLVVCRNVMVIVFALRTSACYLASNAGVWRESARGMLKQIPH